MKALSERIQRGKFAESFKLFTKRQRSKLIFLGVVQVLLGFMDLIAVAILAVLGKLAVTGVQSRQSSGKTYEILQYLGIENQSIQKQALILGAGALTLLVMRSFLSIWLIQKSLKAIGIASSKISATLVSQVFNTNRIHKLGIEPQDVLYSLTQGISLVTIGIVGTFVTIIGDIGLIVLMFIGIILINPDIALISGLLFGTTTFVLSKYLHKRAVKLGAQTAILNVESNRLILETVHLHTDLYVRNKIDVFTNQISNIREQLMDTNRQLIFMPNVSKYVFETTVLLGAFLLAGLEFLYNDAPTAVASLTLFMATGSRVVPALIRAQQGMINIKTNLAASEITLNLISMFDTAVYSVENLAPLKIVHTGFKPEVEIKHGNFSYSPKSEFAIKNVNLKITAGEFVAFVGKSGAGKSTLIDLLIGANNLDSGEIFISGLKPQEVVSKWTGAIGYVPQSVKLIDSTLRENILLGFTSRDVSDGTLVDLLVVLGLKDLLSRENGLDTMISQFSGGLSGGQTQRIGLARALISNPGLIILDEATSALDSETENIVNNLLKTLHGKVTIIVIAHRLSTVQNADCLHWMENGEIVSSGTFEKLRKENQNFENSATLLGL
jgi:ABC-type multidrug transport system fused ATPase/permease subunit